ncbi:MAG: hypothetical protein NT018_11385 [Armatimonadetes bacterium]|nr:hypothetical protein [Armatimonadota bacterium]
MLSETNAVIARMLAHWHTKPSSHLDNVGYASNPEADTLVRADLFAFLLACSIDRTGESVRIWNTPLYLKQDWGHLDPARIAKMEPAELSQNPIIRQIPGQVSRLQLAKTIITLAEVVIEDFDSCPELMLEGSVSDIMDNLQLVSGIGPNVARMIIILRVLYFGLRPSRTGRLLPKLDVHVCRILVRTGLVTDCSERAVRAILKSYPIEDIAAIDQVCWEIGQNYCRPNDPKCSECPLDAVGAKVGLE